MLFTYTKVKICSPDGDTNLFDIVAGVLQGDTLASYLPIICLDYILRTSLDLIRGNGFTLKSRHNPAESITDADNANDREFLANTTTQAEFLLQCLEQAAKGIHMKANTYCCLLQAL